MNIYEKYVVLFQLQYDKKNTKEIESYQTGKASYSSKTHY